MAGAALTLYIARHGETEWNRDGRMQGRLGGPLTDKGHAQARDLAVAARALGVTRVIASSLPRALETARVVGALLALEVVSVEALVETDFGRCSGLTEAAIAEQFPGLRAAREVDKWRHRWPDGESYADLAARLRAAIERGELPGASGTLLVAHQSMNRVVAHVLGRATVAEVLAMAQASDVLLRLSADGVLAHARTGELVWRGGLCGGAPRLN